jgi:hypothetical protein
MVLKKVWKSKELGMGRKSGVRSGSNLSLLPVIIAVLVFNACPMPTSDVFTGITWTAEANGEEDAADSTAIALVFSSAVAGLSADDISVNGDTSAVEKGALSGAGTNWSLALRSVAKQGTVKVAISRAGIEGGEKTVAVYKAPPPVTWTAEANGEAGKNTSSVITFTFSREIPDLAADNISVLNGTGEVTTGELSGSGKSWVLALSAVNAAGDLWVTIGRTGIEAGEKTVAVYKKGETADISYTALADGETDALTSTAITFTFSGAVGDLAADDISVVNGTGEITKGPLSGGGTIWTLALASVKTQGIVKVSITKAGIDNSPINMAVYKKSVPPPPPGKGTLVYTVIVPEGVVPAAGSRIRLEKDNAILTSLNSGGFSGGQRPVTESISAASVELDPGWYALDIVIVGQDDKSAVFHELVEIKENETRGLRFEPPADTLLTEKQPGQSGEQPGQSGEQPGQSGEQPEEPGEQPEEPGEQPEEPGEQPTELTSLLTIKATSANSSGLTIGKAGGSGAARTRALSVSNGAQIVYFTALKKAAQTLTLSGPDAARVSKAAAFTDGDTPGSGRDVFIVDSSEKAETGGDLYFTITAEETGKLSITYDITLHIAVLNFLTVAFVPPGKRSYAAGEAFDPASVTVTGTYDTGEKRAETVYKVEGFDSSVPGTITVRFEKNGVYAYDVVYGVDSSFTLTILPLEIRLIFPYGGEIDGDMPSRNRYTVTEGHTLVIAPILWRVPAWANFQWTVSGGAVTASSGEFLTFKPGTPAGNYDVTVTASFDGKSVSASTTVECVNASSPSSPVRTFSNGTIAPGQFVQPNWGLSLGGYGGSATFNAKTDNNTGNDIRIAGNAFPNWVEPGIIWVMKDENRNGAADDTWYELKGNAEELGMTVTRRYAVTYYKNGSWEDNLGNTGTLGGLQAYPSSWPEKITVVGTRLDIGSGTIINELQGYVDVLDTGFDISDAIQVDGTPVYLDHIDFVRVQTGEFSYAGAFGEKSTEIPRSENSGLFSGGGVASPSLTGTSNGSGGYAYKFVNNSGYDLTVSFEGITDSLSVPADETVTYTSTESKLYYDYVGGNVKGAASGNTLTFSNN